MSKQFSSLRVNKKTYQDGLKAVPNLQYHQIPSHFDFKQSIIQKKRHFRPGKFSVLIDFNKTIDHDPRFRSQEQKDIKQLSFNTHLEATQKKTFRPRKMKSGFKSAHSWDRQPSTKMNNFSVSASKIEKEKKTLTWFLTRSYNPEEKKKKRSKSLRQQLAISDGRVKVRKTDGRVRIQDGLITPWDFQKYDLHQQAFA